MNGSCVKSAYANSHALSNQETLPDVNDAFVIVSREESRRGLASSSSGSVTKPQVTSFVAKSNNPSINGNKKADNNKRCFDIIGYPLGYVKNLGLKSTRTRTFNANSANMAGFASKQIVGTGSENGSLYMFDFVSPLSSNCQTIGNQSFVCYISMSVWHTRLGHPSNQEVDMLLQDRNLTNDSHVSPCDTCYKAKQTREPFPLSDHQTTSIGKLIHLDLWGPYKVISKKGLRYFLTIVDDYTRAVWIYLIKTKDEVYDHFVNYNNMILNQFNCSVKTVKSDNGIEFTNNKMNVLFNSLGIIHQTTCAYTPQKNRMVERKHRHLVNVARSLLFQSGLPLSMWTKCVLTSAYLINRLPFCVLNGKSPFELV
ncbi:ribonuclease H-like domain-containing protein [Tanacetum coccineum]